MYPIRQSTAITVPFFCHDAAGDAVTTLTDGSFTKRISKDGGAFAAMTVTIAELENGWYSIPLSASHSDTNGLMSITFTNAGAKQVNLRFRVETKLTDVLYDMAATAIVSAGAITTSSGAVSTVSTLTGHTAQTADHTAGIADIPTVSEFNARTILAASYFDPAADTVANVTTVATTTTNTDMRGTNSAALATALATAQTDLDTITGPDGVTLATAQALYAPSKAGDSMDMLSISGDSVAADNLEATYDGTGYADDNAPATQTQVGNLSTGSAAISTAATGATVDVGTETLTYTA